MIRHGQAQNNVERRLAGRMDGINLTKDGITQAEHAALMLESAGVCAIYSSPILRAAETARIVSEQCRVPVKTDSRLTEIDMGKFTGMKFEEAFASHGDIFTKFYQSDVEIAHQGVETFDQVKKRVLDMIREILQDHNKQEEDGNIVLVTHLDPIKAVLVDLSAIPPEMLFHTTIENAALNVFNVDENDKLSLYALNVMDASRFST